MKPLPCPACGAWDGTRSDNAPRKCPGCLHLYNPLLPTHPARLRAEGLSTPKPTPELREVAEGMKVALIMARDILKNKDTPLTYAAINKALISFEALSAQSAKGETE